ncbi:DUF418 domain-containing protein [Frankia sp. AgKG'84/4]
MTRTAVPMPTAPTPPARALPPAADRALAPDLARGAMLLFIALANAANCAFAGQPGIDPTPRGAERVVNFLMVTLVHARAYPVFAVMFGYGLIQLATRQRAAGQDERRVLGRRGGALVGFGLVHGTLLYFGDFLGAYGIVGLVATFLLLRRGERFHRVVLWLWVWQTLVVAFYAVTLAAGWSHGHATVHNSPDASLAASSYGRSVLDRLAEWPVHTLTVLPFLVIVWLGMWMARRRLLDDPAAHRVLLRRVAVGGGALSVAGALPYALVSAGFLQVDAATVRHMAMLHDITGEYGGVAYVALFGLLAVRLGARRRGRASAAVVALGRRSLSGYLLQSVLWLVLFSRWSLDLGGSTYVAALAGAGAWAGSMLAAYALQRRGRRGPAETLLRHAVYGTPTQPA